MARLRIEFCGTTTVVPLPEVTTVGRANDCTIVLPDRSLSGVQFKIRLKSKGFQLKHGGAGSTRVNGRETYATTLSDGDVIEAGTVLCVFLEEAGPPRAEAAQPAASVGHTGLHIQTSTVIKVTVGAAAVLALFFFLVRDTTDCSFS